MSAPGESTPRSPPAAVRGILRFPSQVSAPPLPGLGVVAARPFPASGSPAVKWGGISCGHSCVPGLEMTYGKVPSTQLARSSVGGAPWLVWGVFFEIGGLGPPKVAIPARLTCSGTRRWERADSEREVVANRCECWQAGRRGRGSPALPLPLHPSAELC